MTELEKMKRAKMYVDKLANGVNPLTDEQADENDTINQVRISRCLFYVSEVLERVIANGGEVGRRVVVKQTQFTITDVQLDSVEISAEPVGVSIIAKNINAVIDTEIKKCSAVHISNWLLENGYLCENIYGGKRVKITTQKGESIGIFTVDATSQQGFDYKKNVYNPDAQRFVIDNIMKIEDSMI